MPAFRLGEGSYTGFTGGSTARYFHWIDQIRSRLLKEIEVQTIDLTEEKPTDDDGFHRDGKMILRSDHLCIYGGKAICQIEVLTIASASGTNTHTLHGYIEAPGYGDPVEVEPVESIDNSLLGIAREKMGVNDLKEDKTELDPYTPLRWHVRIHTADGEHFIFKGSVFDNYRIEEAFNALIDLFVDAKNKISVKEDRD